MRLGLGYRMRFLTVHVQYLPKRVKRTNGIYLKFSFLFQIREPLLKTKREKNLGFNSIICLVTFMVVNGSRASR